MVWGVRETLGGTLHFVQPLQETMALNFTNFNTNTSDGQNENESMQLEE